MTIKFQIYKCEICGNLIQILQEGGGHPVCCGEEMKLERIQYDQDELGEKHTPKTNEKDGKRYVNVIGHPMNQEHYIQFMESFTPDKKELHLKFFAPGETPEIDISHMPGNVNSIEYCNIHRLWGDNVVLKKEYGDYSI